MSEIDKSKVVSLLNKILEAELAGVVRYTHYSLMVFGYNRIPIVSWLRQQATESMMHATQAGEIITALGEHPSLSIGPLLETHKHDIGDILREALENERAAANGPCRRTARGRGGQDAAQTGRSEIDPMRTTTAGLRPAPAATR